MATYTWTGATNASWSLATNWSPSTAIPTASDDVIFSATYNTSCSVHTNVNCRSLTIDSGYSSTITLTGSIIVGAVTGSGIAPVPLYSSYPALVINGALDFAFNPQATTPGCIQVSSNVEGAVMGISSSVLVGNLPLRLNIGSTGGGATNGSAIFSGSTYVSYLDVNCCTHIGGAPGSQIVLRGGPGIIKRGTVGFVSLAPTSSANPTYVPPLLCLSSTSWEYDGNFPLPLAVGLGCNFRYSGSSTPSSNNSNGVGTTFTAGNKTFYTATNPLNVNVDASATLTCHTSSFIQFSSVNAALHMSGSTTNKWNSLKLFSANLQITSDVWLMQNSTLTPSNIMYTLSRPYVPGTLSVATSTISGSGGNTIYVGGDFMGGNLAANPDLNYPAGPRIVLYGTGYIAGAPFPGQTAVQSLSVSVDLEISSSTGDISWASPDSASIIFTGLNGATGGALTYTNARTWSVYSSSFRPGRGVIDLKGKPVWDMRVGQNVTNTFSSSIVCSGSLEAAGSARINSSSLTNPVIYVHENLLSTYIGGFAGLIQSGSVPIRMIGDLPAVYSMRISPLAANTKCPDIVIDKPGAFITMQNDTSNPAEEKPLQYGNGTFTYVDGEIDAGTSTMELYFTTSIDTGNGVSRFNWYNITVSGSGTGTATGSLIDLPSTLTIGNRLDLGAAGNVTFAGSAGWTCSELVCVTPNRSITLQSGVEYITQNSVNLSSSGAPISMSSSSPTTRASWSVDLAASPVQLYNVNGTRIDSSGGRTIWTTGTILDTINWNPGLISAGSFFTFFID